MTKQPLSISASMRSCHPLVFGRTIIINSVHCQNKWPWQRRDELYFPLIYVRHKGSHFLLIFLISLQNYFRLLCNCHFKGKKDQFITVLLPFFNVFDFFCILGTSRVAGGQNNTINSPWLLSKTSSLTPWSKLRLLLLSKVVCRYIIFKKWSNKVVKSAIE